MSERSPGRRTTRIVRREPWNGRAGAVDRRDGDGAPDRATTTEPGGDISPFPAAAAGPSAAAVSPAPAGERRTLRAPVAAAIAAIQAADPFALAAQVAYSLIFALPSIVLVVVLVAVAVDGWLGFSPLGTLREALAQGLPAALDRPVADLLDQAIARAREPVATVSAVASAAIALFASGAGIAVLARACARASGMADRRPFWARQLLGIGVALLLALLLAGAFALLLFGQTLAAAALGAGAGAAWGWLGNAAALALAFPAVVVLYRAALGRAWRGRTIAIGAAFATLLWFGLSKGFALYLRWLDPGSAYGAAGSLLVLLLFLYLSSLILIAGAIIAAVLRRREAFTSAPPAADAGGTAPQPSSPAAAGPEGG